MDSRPLSPPVAITWKQVWPGMMTSVLAGSPEEAGSPFVVLYRTSAPMVTDTHSQPCDESVTVLSGTLELGVGNEFQEAALRPLGPGSFAVIPGGTPHFMRYAAGSIVQVHGVGPFALERAA